MANSSFFRPLGPGVCPNCRTQVVGKYCHGCGQEYTRRHTRLWQLLGEGLVEFLNWDNKFLRSLRPLLFRPGFLTQEYVAGRRVRYVLPIRFYLISSLLFFLIFQPQLEPQDVGLKTTTATGARQQTLRAFQSPDSSGQTQGDPSSRDTVETPEPPQLNFFGEVSDTASYWGRLQVRINERIQADNGYSFLNQLLRNIPTLAFFLLPFAALILAAIYLRQRRDYLEHFVLTLHIHTFNFLFALLLYGLDILLQLWLDWEAFVVFGIGIGIGIPLYFFASLRRYYGQRWFPTLFRGVLAFGSYLLVVVGVVLAGVVLSAVAYLGL